MNRRAFLYGSVSTVFTVPLTATAQQAVKKPRIGYLAGSSVSNDAAERRAFSEGLSDHGWVEGQNIVVETRYADGNYEKLPALAAELVGLEVAVIVAGNIAVGAARRVTATVPIVMTNQVDPVGMVSSTAFSGRAAL